MQDVALRLPESHLPLLLIQGDLPKAILLERHRQAIAEGRASILFGLDSFAEGLDLPGSDCAHVIIAKLPFTMPDHPIEKTRSRWIEQRGGNPFMEIRPVSNSPKPWAASSAPNTTTAASPSSTTASSPPATANNSSPACHRLNALAELVHSKRLPEIFSLAAICKLITILLKPYFQVASTESKVG